MAEALDDGEFWLPSEFLTDDDILMGTQKCDIGANLFCFPSEFPSGALNSPVESLVGSTETESDEDDYLSGFTRQMARSLLQAETNNSSKTRVMATSPQSPLCGIGSWSGKSSGSSRGSPNDGPSLVCSPPSTPSLNCKDDAWDLLYAAAGQVVRMKLNDEVPNNYGNNRGLLGVPQKSGAVTNAACYSNPALTQQQLQANHFYQLKQQQQQQQQLQQCSSAWGRQVRPSSGPQQQQQQIPLNNGRAVGLANGRCNSRPLGLPPSAWPPLQQQQQQHQHQQQQQNGSGMRAVFLGGSGARRESTGTGVFLPRRNGNSSDSRRKPACSTVLLPARVVQALNLNFEGMGNGGSRYVGGSVHGNGFLSQPQKRSYRPQPAMINTDLQLPQEWTY